MNQTAHISLQCLSISKSVETKLTGCALFSLARPASNASNCLPRFPLERRSVVPSGVPLCASAPPVRGYLRLGAGARKCFFRKTSSFFQKTRFSFKNKCLCVCFFWRKRFGAGLGRCAAALTATRPSTYRVTHRLTPKTILRFTESVRFTRVDSGKSHGESRWCISALSEDLRFTRISS